MTEQDTYQLQIPEEARKFINRSLNEDSVGEVIRSRAANNPQASRAVPAWEKDEALLRLAASGATLTQIAEKTGLTAPKVRGRYRECIRHLWNQSPPATQEGFSMGKVLSLPKPGGHGPKSG